MRDAPNIDDILSAHSRIRPYINKTPVLTSSYINDLIGSELFFKCENFQKAGAFKTRGACNAVFQLNDKDCLFGVATHSSGNHAAALARAASLRGVKSYIVMPSDSSAIKINATQFYGGSITFCEPNLASRESTLEKVIAETGAVEIHPYNDFRIIAGQATAGLELIQDFPELDIVVTPVGGGGLLSGTALTIKYLSPETKVFGTEPEQANDAYKSFTRKSFVPSIHPDTIADGLRTSLGTLTFPIIMNYVDLILTVSELSIVDAMRLVWERMKIIIEPSSAVPVAAILNNPALFKGKKTGVIISGGNVDLSKLPWR